MAHAMVSPEVVNSLFKMNSFFILEMHQFLKGRDVLQFIIEKKVLSLGPKNGCLFPIQSERYKHQFS